MGLSSTPAGSLSRILEPARDGGGADKPFKTFEPIGPDNAHILFVRVEEEMMQMVADLKALVLEIMESAFQSGDVHATQQMGINMSNAVKREGVVIIQNQNVEVYARIMPSMVKMLRLCDAIESNWHNQIEVTVEPHQRQLPPPVDAEDADPVDACCSWMFENRVKWQDMQDLMKARYLEYVIDRSKTKTEAAKWLGVGSTYLCKLSKTAMHAVNPDRMIENRQLS
jgi:hypothetical protein